MTEFKNVNCEPCLVAFKSEWYTVPSWMTPKLVDFRYREVRINGKVYTKRSKEFDTEFNKDRLFRVLAK